MITVWINKEKQAKSLPFSLKLIIIPAQKIRGKLTNYVIVHNGKSMTPDVVKSLNALADSLKNWRNNKQKWEGIFDNSWMPLGRRLHVSKQVAGFDKALEWLLFHKPETGKSLKDDYDAILSLARTIDDNVDKCLFSSIEQQTFRNDRDAHWISDYLTSFEVNLTLFERKIRNIAKMAKNELATETGQKATASVGRSIWTCIKKTPRWICGLIVAVVVAVIAAIIVDILADFGWLERIKDLFTK